MNNDDNLLTVKKIKEGNKNAEEKLINDNSGLVRTVMKWFHIPYGDYEDYYQLGCIGLIKAARQFDIEKNNNFSTYAVWLISGEIKRYIRDNTAVKMSRSIREKYIRTVRAKNKLQNILGREPTISEISEATGDSYDEIIISQEANAGVLSIDYQNDEEGSLENIIGEDNTENISDRVALYQAVTKLAPFERKIVVLRYFKNKTQSETAKILGVTQVQISRKEKSILAALRSELV